MEQSKLFCKGGGCTAKLGAGVLSRVLERLPKFPADPTLLICFDSKDDAAGYKLTDDVAVVQTLDFFPPMVGEPYTFGQIAATNALSDVWAMGGQVKTALNIVCFPEKSDLNILGEMMRGGAEKVAEAGGTLVGGHSIADSDVKYGLSVMGTVHPDRIYANNTPQKGDKLVLTKRLGVGILCTASRVGEASSEALRHADEFLLTAAGQRNRNHTGPFVRFENVSFSMEEVLFDPQTSGGLLVALPKEQAAALVADLRRGGAPAAVVGEVTDSEDIEIRVIG